MNITNKFLTAGLVTAGTFAFSVPALAQDSGVAYAGGSVGDGANGYAGAVVALPGARLGEGLALRAGGGGGKYRYEANGQRIDATYVNAEVALVYQTSGDWGWANFSAGPRLTDTSLKPDDPGNRMRGTRIDAAVQTDGALGNAWRLTWFGSLGINDRAYITQARFGPLVDGGSDTRIGVEGGIQGDRSYTRRSVGGFVSTRITGQWQGLVSGGITDQAGRNVKPYVALGVSRVF
ncbi:cellulose biosynthesis protein BcsS [Novosphingobium mathurense]|uniref:Cellulose biosynthesis protein BcsS n=1 Tax=Novosphingobium mathurense TaxID=428990 RepID=A0A1U6GS31_9SPHN|nr:cellulose biosynthesis protein BcsS [Novosphingobium mathurense]SLJ86306.1 Cellulose biosynthesis protein BcsS [Novosphingobium mathurense]